METDHIGGWGVVLGSNNNNDLFLNDDSHHNADPYSSDSYGGADGFESGSATSTNITFRGCRSWGNSDDGWDLRMAQGLYTFENDWSFHNGFKEDQVTSGGDGEGFKLGTATIPSTTETRRMVKNCLSFENTAGYEYVNNNGYAGSEIYNSTAYNIRGSGFNFQTPGPVISRNNIAYNNLNGNYGVASTHDHNSWDTNGITVSDADFASVNSAGAYGPRQADGSLPNINFLHLAPGSDLIDKGTPISGMSYNGSAPDLGAFETGGVLGASTYNFTQTLKFGSTGNEVTELQKVLIRGGYLKKGSSNGIFGTPTLNAVKGYQKDLGLTPDGIVGVKTREMLNK